MAVGGEYGDEEDVPRFQRLANLDLSFNRLAIGREPWDNIPLR